MIIYRNINGIEFAVDNEKASSLLCAPEVAKQTKGSIYAFVDFLYEQTKKYKPMVATWEITNICNFRCKFCYINSENNKQKQSIQLSKAKEVIDELVDAGLLLVYLTGGEVMSHPNFEDVYIYLKNKGVYVVLLTNLSLLDKQKLELLKKYPPLRVTVSIYGMSDKHFADVTQSEIISFETVLNNILLLKRNNINVTTQTPINKLTVSEYRQMAQWCYDNGIIYRTNNDITDSYVGEDRQVYSINDVEFLKLKESLEFVEDNNVMIDNAKKPKCDFGYKQHFDCVSGKHTFAISYNLHLRPCFNIWETEGPWFDGTCSMKKALENMALYIENKKNEVIDFCHGCVAHEFCAECLLTQNKHKNDLEKYMSDVCVANKRRVEEYRKEKG